MLRGCEHFLNKTVSLLGFTERVEVNGWMDGGISLCLVSLIQSEISLHLIGSKS